MPKKLSTYNQPFELVEHKLNLSANIGISIKPEHSTKADVLVSKADSTMHEARDKCKKAWYLYNRADS